jgi:FG-GAP repeat protein
MNRISIFDAVRRILLLGVLMSTSPTGFMGSIYAQIGGGACKSEQVTPSEVTAIVKEAFIGVFQPAQQRSRGSGPARITKSVAPGYVVLDLNGDGWPDLVVTATYDETVALSSGIPFNFGSIGAGSESFDPRYIVAAGSPAGKSISEQASVGQLFLLIILGRSDDCWRTSDSKLRFALANAINFENIRISRHSGKVKATSAGDSGIIAPPMLRGEALQLTSEDGRNDELIYWTGAWFNWYPFTP